MPDSLIRLSQLWREVILLNLSQSLTTISFSRHIHSSHVTSKQNLVSDFVSWDKVSSVIVFPPFLYAYRWVINLNLLLIEKCINKASLITDSFRKTGWQLHLLSLFIFHDKTIISQLRRASQESRFNYNILFYYYFQTGNISLPKLDEQEPFSQS